MSASDLNVLVLWQAAMTPPPRRPYAVECPADPSPLAARLAKWTALDSDLLRQWLGLNHFAYRPGIVADFPADFKAACDGDPSALIARTAYIAADRESWKQWFESVVSFPILPAPYGRALLLPVDNIKLDRLIELVNEANVERPRTFRSLSTIVLRLDFLHTERRKAFDAILSGVFHRSPADREEFFTLHMKDRDSADNLSRAWSPNAGRQNWCVDGLRPAKRAALLAKQIEKIQWLRANTDAGNTPNSVGSDEGHPSFRIHTATSTHRTRKPT